MALGSNHRIYSQKQRWKLGLFVFALAIVAVSLWYTELLVEKISAEEKSKVRIWAEAVQKRSDLVRYTSALFTRLQEGERKKVELYLEATRYLASPNVIDLDFTLSVLNDNTTVPVILTDDQQRITSYRNIEIPDTADKNRYLQAQLRDMGSQYPPLEIVYFGDSRLFLYYKDSKIFSELKSTFEDLQESFISDLMLNAASSPVLLTDSAGTAVIEAGNVEPEEINTPEKLAAKLLEMREQHEPIAIEIDHRLAWVFFEDSFLLTQLKYYPLAQLGVIALFVFIGYLLFSTARKAEQNQVWVGMSKETAHQLGTPLSSMIGWIEMLKADEATRMIGDELEKDVSRLQTVTERFSKIGSQPELRLENLSELIRNLVTYFSHRAGKNVRFSTRLPATDAMVVINHALFEWVLENLIKNALDAMEGKGRIEITVSEGEQRVMVDVADTGKGIAPGQQKAIFQPGFTTKKRGWGLGLSLSRRIIKEYHKGKIYVLKSEPGQGTTFRISLKK